MMYGIGCGRRSYGVGSKEGVDVESWGDDMHMCLVSSHLYKMPNMVECEE